MNTGIPTHLKIESVERLAGFSVEDAAPGEMVKIIVRGFFSSDQKEFYDYVDQIASMFSHQLGWREQINAFLILIHQDLSADVYVNDFPIIYEGMHKRDLQAGEIVMLQDIADIRSLKFLGIEINKTDNLIFSFRIGWKFGLFFDFAQWESGHFWDVDALYRELGWHYKRLFFQKEYEILENRPMFEQMRSDGWFPFIQILGVEFVELSHFYKDKTKFLSLLTHFVNKFDKDRVMRFVNRWWNNKLFEQKKNIILAGIEAYLTNTQAGFINCIKNLPSEIDGILRLHHFEKNKTGKRPHYGELTQHLKKEAEKKFDSMEPLSLPGEFCRYLDEVFLKDFDLKTGQVDWSRHSTMHGVANVEDYTKVKALQCILILDQMYFYLS